MSLQLSAPAKLNIALEVLSRRLDGYHELVSVMQTIDLADRVRISEAGDIEIHVGGERTLNVPVEGPRNLAFRAAVAMREAAGSSDLGVRIDLDKGIPAGTGLGGGSSDAAAVIRGLNVFWDLHFEPQRLGSIASGIGSDVPFFLQGGSALVSGRGEQVAPLPDAPPTEYTLFVSPVEIEDKTRRMFSMLTALDFSDGHRTWVLAETIRRGLPLDETAYLNAFDRHIAEAVPPMGRAFAYCRAAGLAVVATGSGPSFFTPVALSELRPELLRHIEREYDVTAIACRSLPQSAAVAVAEQADG